MKVLNAVALTALTIVLFSGCGDDTTTPPANTNEYNLSAINEITSVSTLVKGGYSNSVTGSIIYTVVAGGTSFINGIAVQNKNQNYFIALSNGYSATTNTVVKSNLNGFILEYTLNNGEDTCSLTSVVESLPKNATIGTTSKDSSTYACTDGSTDTTSWKLSDAGNGNAYYIINRTTVFGGIKQSAYTITVTITPENKVIYYKVYSESISSGITGTFESSGINADLLDGLNSTKFIRETQNVSGTAGGDIKTKGNFIGDGSQLTGIAASSIIDFGIINNEKAALYRYNLTKNGTGSGNVIQGFAIDPYTNEMFTLHVTGNPDTAVVNRFNAHGAKAQTSTHWNSTPLNTIGHQALSISWDKDGNRWLWVSQNKSISGYSNRVTRFQVSVGTGTKLLISNVQHFTLFTNTSSGHCTPTISVDGKYLIAETVQGDNQVVRVFDLNVLQNGGADDYSDQAQNEFIFLKTTASFPLQSLACDGSYIYICFGDGSTTNNNYISIYTMHGTLVHTIDNFIIGKTNALGDGTDYEQEGTGWVWMNGKPYFAVSIASGTIGNRVNRIYALGALNAYK